MQPLAYIPAATVDEAVKALQEGGELARILSGGTDVIVQAREGRRNVAMMVDVKSIPEMNVLRFDQKEGLTLGATVPCYKIYENETIQRAYPALIDSASLIGGIQIQSRASLGGNLCNSSPAADSIPTLIALEATCTISGARGTRTVPVEEFCTGPGLNQLQAGELLVSFRFPPPRQRSGARFLRFIPRNEMDIAVVNAAVSLTLNERRDTIEWARVAIGAVAPTPLLVAAAGDALAGAPATAQGIAKAVDAARAAARPISDMRGSVAQRRHLVGVFVRRAIEGAIERAKAG
ncbi:MAG TPA: xanthine dehydrogenase family protein subunit M [Dehalococcoidia bacterium]|nr:xanthine dehydrogenase family protein subunit M [Dehalococcoidia bacterium]